MIRRSFHVEQKFFAVEKVREWIYKTEKDGGFAVTLDLRVEAARWLIW